MGRRLEWSIQPCRPAPSSPAPRDRPVPACLPDPPGLHRRACWARDGRRFCVPSRRDDSLLLLDFAPTPEAGCYALRDEEAEARRARDDDAAAPPAAAVALSQAAVCVAAHPTLDLFVAGSLSSCMAAVL